MGRPVETPPEVRKEDGRRLAAALYQTGWSETRAAERTKIRQGSLNAIKNGHRALSRENLRAIATKLKISADYLLGVPGATMTVGEAPAPGAMEEALRARVVSALRARELGKKFREPGMEDLLLGAIAPGEVLVARLVDLVLRDLEAAGEWLPAFIRSVRAVRQLEAEGHGDSDAVQLLNANLPRGRLGPTLRFPEEGASFALWIARRIAEADLTRTYATAPEAAVREIFRTCWADPNLAALGMDGVKDYVAGELAARGLLSESERRSTPKYRRELAARLAAEGTENAEKLAAVNAKIARLERERDRVLKTANEIRDEWAVNPPAMTAAEADAYITRRVEEAKTTLREES